VSTAVGSQEGAWPGQIRALASEDHGSCRPLPPGSGTANTYWRARASIPLPAMAQTPSAQWSRPTRTDVCSMFARMSWYASAAPGIRRAAPIRVAGQNGSSRHALAQLAPVQREDTNKSADS
jgi:hypothetical protein